MQCTLVQRGIVALALICCIVGAPTRAESSEFAVELRKINDLKSLFAVVQTVDVTLARARIGGTLIELLVDEGAMVKAGERLAVVRDPKQNLQIDALASKIRSLSAQRELARTALNRVQKLRGSGNISQARLDEATTELEVVNANLAALKSERAVVLQAQVEGNVLAPASGRVLQVGVTKGSVVLPGETIAAIAAETYILRMLLPERHARFIKVGDKVLVGNRGMSDGAPANQQKTFDRNRREGDVRQVYPELDRGRVVADVTVDGLGDFFVGERVRVWVSAGERQAYVIPPEYLHWRYGLSYVWLTDGTEVVVQPGMPVEGGIEILSGLQDGDRLALGAPVKAMSGNSSDSADEQE